MLLTDSRKFKIQTLVKPLFQYMAILNISHFVGLIQGITMFILPYSMYGPFLCITEPLYTFHF